MNDLASTMKEIHNRCQRTIPFKSEQFKGLETRTTYSDGTSYFRQTFLAYGTQMEVHVMADLSPDLKGHTLKIEVNWPLHGSVDPDLATKRLKFQLSIAEFAATLKTDFGDGHIFK